MSQVKKYNITNSFFLSPLMIRQEAPKGQFFLRLSMVSCMCNDSKCSQNPFNCFVCLLEAYCEMVNLISHQGRRAMVFSSTLPPSAIPNSTPHMYIPECQRLIPLFTDPSSSELRAHLFLTYFTLRPCQRSQGGVYFLLGHLF